MAQIYPIPLSKLELETIIDEEGFTSCEKKALRNTWAMHISRISIDLCRSAVVNFLTNDESYIEKFRLPSGKLLLQSLSAHSSRILNIYELLIQNLDDSRYVFIMLNTMSSKHIKAHIKLEDIQEMVNYMNNAILAKVHRYSSPTLISALAKLGNLIVKYHVAAKYSSFSSKKLFENFT